MEKMTEKKKIARGFSFVLYLYCRTDKRAFAIIGIRNSYIKKIATLCSVLGSDILQN